MQKTLYNTTKIQQNVYCMKKSWGLFRRKRKKGYIWYYWYYDEKGVRHHQSTGKSVKWKAERYVQDLFSETSTNPNITLNEFATGFFDWNTSKWISRRYARGYKFTKPMSDMRSGHLKNHILKSFGTRKVKDLTSIEIEDWLLNLNKKSNTKNHILGTFNIVLNEAKREGIISKNPIEEVERVSKSDYKKTDSLSIAEIKQLFPQYTQKLREIWRRDDLIVIYYLMISSGIRSGEARALMWKNILWDKSAILVTQAVKADQSIGSPKTNEVRGIIVPSRTIEMLRWWKEIAPFTNQEDFVFSGKRSDIPINRDVVSKEFIKGLQRAKIETEGRNLRTHSLRHTYNTLMKGVLTADILREFTGHRSEQMTQRYDHPHLVDRLKQFEHSKEAIDSTWNF
jgi:integrase